MFEIIKAAIASGNYKLEDIREKIMDLYVRGTLDRDQLNALLAMSSEYVSADAERPEIMEMLKNLADRVAALEAKLNGEEAPAEYEEWKRWDGISDKYQYGAIVSHNGKLWISVYQGHNVWEPGVAGTESLWHEYTEE